MIQSILNLIELSLQSKLLEGKRRDNIPQVVEHSVCRLPAEMSKISGFTVDSADHILALKISLWLVIGRDLCNHGSLNAGS
jgi:hypothetical protein